MLIYSNNLVSNNSFSSQQFFFKDWKRKIKFDKLDDIKTCPDLFVTNDDYSTLLHEAAMHNKPEICRYLLRKGLSPNSQNLQDQTPFMLACSTLNEKLIREFLLYNPEINAQDITGETPLHKVVENPKISKLLLDSGANPYIQDINGNTVVHCAYKYPKTLEMFLKNKVTPNAIDKNGQTLFHKVAKENNLEIGALLKQYNAEINFKDLDGKTPIFYAKNLEILDWLLDNNAKLNAVDNEGRTVLHEYTLQSKNSLVVDVLKRNLDPNISDNHNNTPILYAQNNIIRKILLDNNANPNVLTSDKSTLLHKAIQQNNLKVAHTLVSHNADANALDKAQKTPMDYARSEDARKLLIVYGANPNGQLYLHQAIANKRAEFIDVLLAYGANTEAENFLGRTPVFYCNNLEDLKKLCEHKVNINHTDKIGNTPLHVFAAKGKTELVQYLLDQKAEILPNNNGEKYFDIMAKQATYKNWSKPFAIPARKLSFGGYHSLDYYGTERERNILNKQITLTKEEINNIVKNAPNLNEGLLQAQKKLSEQASIIGSSIDACNTILAHALFVFKGRFKDIAEKNPAGSQYIPVVSTAVLADAVLSGEFGQKIKGYCEDLSEDMQKIIDVYYNNNIYLKVEKYRELNDYLSDGVKFLQAKDGDLPLYSVTLDNLEKNKNRIRTLAQNTETKLDTLGEQLDNIGEIIVLKQEDRQMRRLKFKTARIILLLG